MKAIQIAKKWALAIVFVFVGLPTALGQAADEVPADALRTELFGNTGLPGLGDLKGLDTSGTGQFGKQVKISAMLRSGSSSRQAELVITAQIDDDWHIYSVTQPKGGPLPTRIRLHANNAVRLAAPFTTTTPPKTHVGKVVFKGITVEEHYERAQWVAPVEITAGTDMRNLQVTGVVETQACSTRDKICEPLELRFVARYAGTANGGGAAAQHVMAAQVKPAPTRLTGSTSRGFYQQGQSHGTMTGHIEPATVAPGQTATLVLTMMPQNGWHTYALADVEPEFGNKSTLIVVDQTSGLRSQEATTDAHIIEKEPSEILKKLNWPMIRYYDGRVSWKVPIRVPQQATSGEYRIGGIIGFQLCQDNGQCENPQAARFEAMLEVDPTGGEGKQPLTFASAEYPEAAKLAETRPSGGRSMPAPADVPPPQASDAPSPQQSQPYIIDDSGYDLQRLELRQLGDDKQSIVYYLAIAFLGGLILNLMPCVLPVIGLKIMSFVQQAGQSRRQAFILNLWYSAGILIVFLVIGGFAVGASANMGDQFGSLAFNVFMCGLIFAMALSLLGVWEIPIPGFVGGSAASKWMDKEGPSGAFIKGVLTTILATPCLGPLMAPALSWAVQQPPGIAFTIFTALGLGMALPYLIIGAYPSLVRFIPKPGEWMVTFKQIMGFVLLGTVLFFLSFMPSESLVPTITLLTGIGLACWWVARVGITASTGTKLNAWLTSGIITAGVAWFAFGYLYQQVMKPRAEQRRTELAERSVGDELKQVLEKLQSTDFSQAAVATADHVRQRLEKLDNGPYQPFSLSKLDRIAVDNGRTVLVDFTADWCANCKVFEAAVLHSDKVEQAIEQNEVVTMKADYTDKPPHLKQVIRALGSTGVPVIAVFPGDDPYRPFVFHGAYTTDQILAAIRQSGTGEGRPSSGQSNVVASVNAMQR